MPNSVEHISEQLFKTIKGFGNEVVMFSDSGKKVVDPADARRYYVPNLKMMLNYDNDENTNEVVVNLSAGTDIDKIRPMLDAIRTIANRFLVEYTVKTFGKTIGPKDFSFMAKSKVDEGFSGWHGSARKSINELGDAKIIVRHKRSVDEEKRGARTRQIESIFIENAEGERFKFPNKNLTAAKAMLKHVNEGGAPHDDFGQHIYSVMEELEQLKKFQRYNRRNDFFESEQEISEEIGARVNGLRATLKQMSGPKGYAHHFESFNKSNGNEATEEQINELRDAVTVQYFDERIADSLPYVAKVIEGFRSRQEKEQEIVDFARMVMQKKGDIVLNREIDMDNPEGPAARRFRDPAAGIAAWVNYIAPYLKDDDLANKMMQISDTVFEVGSKHVNLAQQAINVIKQNASVSEATVEEKTPADQAEIARINETFDKYNVRKIFGV